MVTATNHPEDVLCARIAIRKRVIGRIAPRGFAYATDEIRRREYLDLLHEPDLTVVAFRRRGWGTQDYQDWSRRLLATGEAFVVPTTHEGETVTRFAVVNPETTEADIDLILDTMV